MTRILLVSQTSLKSVRQARYKHTYNWGSPIKKKKKKHTSKTYTREKIQNQPKTLQTSTILYVICAGNGLISK